MNLTVNNYDVRTRQPKFTGALDGLATCALKTLDTNEMANAVLIDLGAMVVPRSCYDAKNRNKDAGIETFFRELSGTFINCLSAGLLAVGISRLVSNRIMPEVNIKPDTWFSDNSMATLHRAWLDSDNNTRTYAKTVLENISGRDGKNITKFNNINWDNIDWIDENKWTKINWINPKYKDVANSLKTKDGIINTLTEIIEDKNIAKSDKKNVLKIMEARITNALGANRDLTVNIGDKKWADRLEIILRDTYDMGKDIFTNKNVNIEQALKKIKKINKIKIFGALAGASTLGLTNQHINRKLTEKRTGKKGFVGDVDYANRPKTEKDEDVKPKNIKTFWMKKILASAGMVAMVISVMKVKNFKDFVKKLQFTGPVTSGNAIKTVYAANIVGRFLAADNENELKESVTRDYFGFLNWLVFGGFAAKGVANILDPKRENLFNQTKEGKGIKHWLNDLSLKTHAEVAAKGTKFAKKNILKLNIAHASGLLYSGITLGYLLPMINDKLAKKRGEKEQAPKANA